MGFFDGIAGSLVSGALGAFGQDEANETNMALSEEQMAFQERMSSTAHQREVKDLKAAGLNPMLSAKLGGSSTPVGSMARVENVADASVRSSSAYMANQLVKSQIEQTQSQTEVNRATAEKVKTDARLSLASALQGEYTVRQNELRENNEQFGEWIASQMRADISRNLTTNLSNFVERETLHDLIEYSTGTKGYSSLNFQARRLAQDLKISEQEFKNLVLEYTRGSLDIPRGKALSDFYNSSFGHEIAPYLSSTNDIMNIGASAIGTGIKLFRKPPADIVNHYRSGHTTTNIFKGD